MVAMIGLVIKAFYDEKIMVQIYAISKQLYLSLCLIFSMVECVALCPVEVGAVSENAVAFGVNEQLKRFLIQHHKEYPSSFLPSPHHETNSVLYPFLTGGFTGIFTTVALCPSGL